MPFYAIGDDFVAILVKRLGARLFVIQKQTHIAADCRKELPVDKIRIAVTLHLVLLQVGNHNVLCRQLFVNQRQISFVRLKDDVVCLYLSCQRRSF